MGSVTVRRQRTSSVLRGWNVPWIAAKLSRLVTSPIVPSPCLVDDPDLSRKLHEAAQNVLTLIREVEAAAVTLKEVARQRLTTL